MGITNTHDIRVKKLSLPSRGSMEALSSVYNKGIDYMNNGAVIVQLTAPFFSMLMESK